jgi:deoxyribodipyrimidine photolyase-like uncharacterized protein
LFKIKGSISFKSSVAMRRLISPTALHSPSFQLSLVRPKRVFKIATAAWLATINQGQFIRPVMGWR